VSFAAFLPAQGGLPVVVGRLEGIARGTELLSDLTVSRLASQSLFLDVGTDAMLRRRGRAEDNLTPNRYQVSVRRRLPLLSCSKRLTPPLCR
jgi:hypothetical protein